MLIVYGEKLVMEDKKRPFVSLLLFGLCILHECGLLFGSLWFDLSHD